MSFSAGVVLTVALQKIDAAPDAQAAAQSDHDRLQSVHCTVEKFHINVLTFCRVLRLTKLFDLVLGMKIAAAYSAAVSSSDRSISYRSKISSCVTTCCRFRRVAVKNLSTSKVFFLSASARYL